MELEKGVAVPPPSPIQSFMEDALTFVEACERGDADAVIALLKEEGNALDREVCHEGATAALQNGHLTTAQCVTRACPDTLELRDVRQALHNGCEENHHDVVEWALERRGESLRDEGLEGFIIACANGYMELVVMMYEWMGDDLFDNNNYGFDQAREAAQEGNHTDVVQWLEEAKAAVMSRAQPS